MDHKFNHEGDVRPKTTKNSTCKLKRVVLEYHYLSHRHNIKKNFFTVNTNYSVRPEFRCLLESITHSIISLVFDESEKG